MRKTLTVWMTLLACVAFAATAIADGIRIEIGETGLLSLTYKGVEYADPAGAGALGFTGAGAAPRPARQEDAGVFVKTPTSVTADGTTITQTYAWGTFVVDYEAKGADLTVTATLRNTSGKGLEGWRANVLQLNDRLVFRPGGDPHGFSPYMQWSHYFELNAGARDGYAHLTQQYPHVYWWVDSAAPFDKQAVKVMFADLTGTFDTGVNRVKTDGGDRWPVFVAANAWEMAPPGQVQQNTVKVAIRFRDQNPDARAAIEALWQRVLALESKVSEGQTKVVRLKTEVKQSGIAGMMDRGTLNILNLSHHTEEEISLGEESELSAAEKLLVTWQAEWDDARAEHWAAVPASMPSAIEVCADGYEAWGRYNHREMSWTDRRSIGAFFGCPDASTSATNPNGWFKDPDGVDTTTPEGRQAFAKRLLEHVDRSIEVLRQADAQGVIWYDMEGHRYPQPHISYVGDPRLLDPEHPHHKAFAPELNTPVEYNGETMPVVDACFRKWKDAGFKTGVTIRPQVMTYWPPVPLEQAQARLETARQRVKAAQDKLARIRDEFVPHLDEGNPVQDAEQDLNEAQVELVRAREGVEKAKLGALPRGQIHDKGSKEILSKARYAHDRWGCTLFYVDSISGVFGYWDMIEAVRALPNCLFLPEWATARSYRCSAQMSVTFMTGYRRGVPPEIQAAWPDAFCVMSHLDYAGIAAGSNQAARDDLLTAVRRGNIPLFDCFYNNTAAIKAIRDVYAETGVRHSPLAEDQTVSATPGQPLSITLTATDDDDDALRFAILGPPAHGILSAFDATTGHVTYTPSHGWKGTDRFTFKAVDSSGLNSNRGQVTIDLNDQAK